MAAVASPAAAVSAGRREPQLARVQHRPVGGALDRSGEQVGLADEARDEAVGGPVVDVDRRAQLLDATFVHDREAIRHGERLALVVGDVDEGHVDLALEALQHQLHRLAQLQVERAERLVEQHHLRARHERPRDGDALALAARELVRQPLLVAGHRDQLERLPHARRDLALVDAAHPQWVGDVALDGHVREQRVALEDGRDVAAVGRRAADVDALELDGAGVGPLEAGDHAQRGGLARAARPEQREELALADLERQIGDRGWAAGLVGLGHAVERHAGARDAGRRGDYLWLGDRVACDPRSITFNRHAASPFATLVRNPAAARRSPSPDPRRGRARRARRAHPRVCASRPSRAAAASRAAARGRRGSRRRCRRRRRAA